MKFSKKFWYQEKGVPHTENSGAKALGMELSAGAIA